MKRIYFLIIIFIVNLGFAQTTIKVINGVPFKIVTVSIEGEEQLEYIALYRNDKKILTHTIAKFEGDCSSENIELGDYKIVGTQLIFYTYWASGDRMMKNIYPYGFRKQIYSVDANGIVSLESSKLYIESYIDAWNEHKGLKYLKNKPKTAEEIELLNDYISKAEKMYKGDFVLGKNKDRLEAEVRKNIGEVITENTKYWKEVYGGNCKL